MFVGHYEAGGLEPVRLDMALDRVGGPAIRRLELVLRQRGGSSRIVVEEFFAGLFNETQRSHVCSLPGGHAE